MKNSKTILFFDGICGLCNKSVDFLIKIDKNNKLLYAPLQGDTAQSVLEKKYTLDLDSMALSVEGKIYTKSTAVLKSLIVLGGFWSFFGIFLIIPKSIRDWIYLWIAKNRYKVFGKKENCRIPTKKEREKILL